MIAFALLAIEMLMALCLGQSIATVSATPASPVAVLFNRNMKIGHFALAFEDLTMSMPGLSVTEERRFFPDSLRRVMANCSPSTPAGKARRSRLSADVLSSKVRKPPARPPMPASHLPESTCSSIPTRARSSCWKRRAMRQWLVETVCPPAPVPVPFFPARTCSCATATSCSASVSDAKSE